MASIAQRAGYVSVIIGACTAFGTCVAAVNAQQTSKFTSIIETQTPAVIQRTVGTELDDVRASQSLVLQRIERLSTELSSYHSAVSGYRDRVDEMERKLEERLSGDND